MSMESELKMSNSVRLAILFLFIGQFALANVTNNNSVSGNCFQNLTKNYQRDSAHFQIHLDEIDYESQNQIEKIALEHLLEQFNCDDQVIKNYHCSHISEFEYSYVCSASIQLGYFFIAIDMLENVNFIFNRYD